ncbi:uncharacterized protein BDCG_02860 [Blastomyces dermatitidis ER-3]|uniref:Hsp70 family chaperone n=1 Tax=Ajellomyces dermatitidis (strain ER-3 / ATCC MYA-2586) TaxID=559297 RepID=A0ABP2EUY1_AJEDR|nr:uncharacterized protein BDCG_02860 [Blastomyces dermatitidis ER-3]EEQ87740.1 hypothetical protein BDCG_02860 [Blastomyces dermatitidis ER-3]
MPDDTRSMELDDEWQPDVVVGVDFGLTGTGVSYSYAPEWPAPKTLQHWPGKMIHELANKVPTQLEYDKSNVLKSWGFQCSNEGSEADIKEYFKLFLSPDYKDPQPGSPTRKDALKWFRDYTRCVNEHIISHFAGTIPDFPSLRVEFVYSIPTTWRDPRVRAELQQYIYLDSKNHKATIGLTEAEAAAVYACKQHYQKGDVILVCDAGGGTTDVNVLKILSSKGEPSKLEPLSHVEGQPIGSVFIDFSAHQLIFQRLENVRDHLPASPKDIAWEMMSGGFERFKCSFGTNTNWTTSSLRLKVPFLTGMNFPEAEVYNGQIAITSDEIKQLFDVKIEEMYALIEDQLGRVQKKHPEEKISYLVLSGGFGSSPYVKRRLLERYESENASCSSGAMKVLIAEEPQLAVVEGLVMNRIQHLHRGVIPFGSRCSPVSYGILCDKAYKPRIHLGQPVRYDARDKKIYAVDQIDWIIIQGGATPPTGISKRFNKKVDPKRIQEPWKVEIVMSTLAPERLPQNMADDGAERLCEISIFTDDVGKKQKNHRWYHYRPSYYFVKLEIRAVIGPANLQFQLWDTNGCRIRTSGHDPIAVKWEPVKVDVGGGNIQNGNIAKKNDGTPLELE